jgi:hypothetical protein
MCIFWANLTPFSLQAMVLYWLATGFIYMNMAQWAPTYFQVKLGSTPAEAGQYLAAANLLCIPCNFLSGVVESAMIKSGMSLLRIRKVRQTPSWPRSWANFSLLWLYSHRNPWANLYKSGQPNTLLAQGHDELGGLRDGRVRALLRLCAHRTAGRRGLLPLRRGAAGQ